MKQSERRYFAAGSVCFLFFANTDGAAGRTRQGLTVGGTMESKRTFLIVTNNPLVAECVPADYAVDFENITYREILVKVRDLVYAGHRLYTHPLSGSVKPNETPYKSVVVSRLPKGMEPEEAAIISNSIETFDKFTPRKRELTQQMFKDFQLIDYTLLCGAVGLDAAAGLSNRKSH